MECNYISDLHPGRKNWVIQAKVLSIWVLCEFFTKRVLLLADEKGDTIEATIVFTEFEYEIPRFIKDGEWYSLSDFKVIKPTLKERNTTHPYQIKVWEKTKMNLIQPITCKNYFRFEDFADINHARVNEGVTFDVCGCIIDVSEMNEGVSVVPQNGRTNLCDGVVIKLLNGRYTMYCQYLWLIKDLY
ncbi:PREDICTED: uncharacterized protein LOC104731397 isoform X1 [Camelina sativa]|uniref:Uncharacterized protein LOC104731397 isoform X1 n=1 Tax=Camelina sativa TaxID=90675 RepID=A0ABM0V0P2_CAMSA|nr:PREDICTED: uncharacterized protein LOC104731397 isoform X1 [Camelina sativa]